MVIGDSIEQSVELIIINKYIDISLVVICIFRE